VTRIVDQPVTPLLPKTPQEIKDEKKAQAQSS